jgi:thiol-disulfide isomerase/thioredoxin
VSRSVSSNDAAGAQEYSRSWRALRVLVEGGASFSGYERHCCFLNTGSKRFANVSATSGFDLLDDGRAVGLVDWDADGDLDVWLAHRTAPRLRYLRNESNESSAKNRFLGIRLVGRTCNRDAIGARLELHIGGDKPQRLLKTVRAGEGFIAQSSKWVHFGLGPKGNIDRLVVRWPDGPVEEFRGLEPSHRYRITQGTGQYEPWQDAARPYLLEPSTPEVPPPADAERLPFPARVPLPTLTYRDFDGKVRHWKGRGPLLLILWASWCAPCVEELRKFAQNHERLKKQGLSIIALTVEDLDPTKTSGATAAKEFARRLGLPFQTGLVDPTFHDQLAIVHGTLLHDQRPFPVPMSLLVDADGWWTVTYRGAVQVDRVVEDLKLCSLPPDQYLEKVLPFRGRWYQPPLQPGYLAGHMGFTGDALQAAGYLDESLRYWKAYVDYNKKVPRPKDAAAAQAWDRDVANIIVSYAVSRFLQQRRHGDAIEMCDVALKLQPDLTTAVLIRADLCAAVGRGSDAVDAYRQLLSTPGEMEPRARHTAATQVVLLLAADPDPGVRNGREAVAIGEQLCAATNYQDLTSLDLLSMAYAEAGRFDEAVQMINRALSIAESAGQAEPAGGLHHRRQLYEQGQPYRVGR